MGASLSWYAVRGKAPEAVLEEFGLKNVGKDYQKTRFSGGLLPNGWFLVNHERHEFTNNEVQRLSRGAEVVACFVEEHVMVSRAACCKDGEQIWSVTHDAQESDDHLEVEGEPPAGFAAIRNRLTRQQEDDKGADFIFNIPIDLAAEITGYSHEEEAPIEFDHFTKPTFFQRVFGK
jgi:hypothetical protein